MQLTLQPIKLSYPDLTQLKNLVFKINNKNTINNRKKIPKPKIGIKIIAKKIL